MTTSDMLRPERKIATAGPAWWKSAVVYQVYPRSFADSDGDGVGDLGGVIEHLDHIAGLGVDVIWLSPVYQSPHDDNGYDISDYRRIDPAFGTLVDLDELIQAVHDRGMRIIMDLVVNHTSDEHDWFVRSRADRSNDRADWYIWRDPRPGREGGTPGAEPNNWGSFFSGSAWEWEPRRGQYYLHLFSRKQPDLNWENPQVRAAVFDMMRWWLDRGIDGFRMDVINFISKDQRFPDGPLTPAGYGDGMPFFAYGPRVHEFLAEMNDAVFGDRRHEYLTVGEMPGVTPERAQRFTDAETGQLNMVFQFEHVELDQVTGKWDLRPVTLRDLKRSLGRWQEALADGGWNSLYWNNHDQPRVVSRFGNDTTHWYESATALATVLHLHRGTPYIYQGEELGMTNVPFAHIDDFRDIETLNFYASAMTRGHDERAVLAALRHKSRDNARTPVQWDASPSAGFTKGKPWIAANPNHSWLNAAAQVTDPGSIYAYYRRLIAFRHADPVVVDGSFLMLEPDDPQLYAFRRELAGSGQITVIANLSDHRSPLPASAGGVGEVVLTNRDHGEECFLLPWEVRVYRTEL
jgi:oligo-1,6-glucosidase